MNTSSLKSYAPAARRAFIEAVTARAGVLGLREDGAEPIAEEGDIALIGGQPFPRSVAAKRRRLEEQIARTSFDQVMEAMAYTWFNRFVAIRYMELHGYLDHGYRVLSHPEAAGRPEILEHATEVDLPGLDRDRVIELKLDGTKDEELYRLLLLAQCNALHQAMPFLFEKIGDETELLLPANLLHTDSLIRQLVEQVDEELWQEIEIIGWLYQFYISEKKDQVIGKVVASVDIPAATQLFTPNWIVKYMVQNSLGAQWLATYPDSRLKREMEYYIEPAEQTEEVKAQLTAITPSSLNPEEMTLIDPASGSGHILVEAYELFKAIYLERGYRRQDVAQLILEKNLYGLEICPRAAQLTGFALMMKARADDKELFERGVKLNVMALVDSAGFDAEELAKGVELGNYGLKPGDLTELKRLSEHATTFGSLIQVPEGLAAKLPALKALSEATSEDLFVAEAIKRLEPILRQAELLANHYDAVVANPPYMGIGYFNARMKDFVTKRFPEFSGDLLSAFVKRGLELLKANGLLAFITIPTWTFLPTFEPMRQTLLRTATLTTLVDNGRGIWGSDFGSSCFSIRGGVVDGYRAICRGLSVGKGKVSRLSEIKARFLAVDSLARSASQFQAIPGCPFTAYLSDGMLELFSVHKSLDEFADVRQGVKTGDIGRFVRFWHEVSWPAIAFDVMSREQSSKALERWYPCNKGGDFRRWFGNMDYVLDWEGDGLRIRTFSDDSGRLRSRPQNLGYFFKEGITWSTVTMGRPSFRLSPVGRVFESGGSTIFPHDAKETLLLLGCLNSCISEKCVDIVSPKVSLGEGAVTRLVIPAMSHDQRSRIETAVAELLDLHRRDWASTESAFGFATTRLLQHRDCGSLVGSFKCVSSAHDLSVQRVKSLESQINATLLDVTGLVDELHAEVPDEAITVTSCTEIVEVNALIGHAIGCMMGRYSLDEPGLIYAHSGNEGFDPSRYRTFPADEDGIIPITDYTWFEDDAAHRFERFLAIAWPEKHLEDNLKFVADGLSPKRGERPRTTLRRHLSSGFFKQHLSTYKKRPIYWLFTSGKQKAFQCLVYLHRYNEGTLARMRTEYVIPLQGKIASRIEQLDGDIAVATSSSHRKKAEKERDTLVKQRTELQEFDEKLRHYADQRIALDLDDGVKVNYGKFGNLLAEVKAVTGKKPTNRP